ncbi:MAG: hypothetical protein FWF55_05755 [Treponema sp.]|nr:hypothetical protein [Treponema sp.]
MTRKFTAAAVFLLLCYALCAQDEEYFVEYTDDGKPQFFQRIEWEAVEHALHYELSIYTIDGDIEYSSASTEDTSFLVSLPPGKYRCSVTPFDLLGSRGEPSEWKEFEVFPAYQPLITSFTPEVFYLDRILDRDLRLSGNNFLEESEIYLKSIKGNLYPEKITIVSDKSAILVFDDMKLEPGSYDIYIKNPGGLSTESGKFVVGYRKPLDIFLKLAYTPLIPFREKSEIDVSAISFIGGSFSFEVISSKRGDINGGLELSASLNYFDSGLFFAVGDDSDIDVLYSADGILYPMFDVNIVMQKRFNRGRMAFSFRFGVGIGSVNDLELSEKNDFIVKMNLGLEYMVRLYKVIYLEVGADFSIFPSDENLYFLKPRVGVVWQF